MPAVAGADARDGVCADRRTDGGRRTAATVLARGGRVRVAVTTLVRRAARARVLDARLGRAVRRAAGREGFPAAAFLRAGFAACGLRCDSGAAFFCARRARFHALRAAADCLRAFLASRLASFKRLRARLSSFLAMRTRCFATSAWSRARSRGSAGKFIGSLLPLFFIFLPAKREGRPVSHNHHGLATASLIHRICA
jgi:hypothetical protein